MSWSSVFYTVSALGVSHEMRSISVRYLLIYLLTYLDWHWPDHHSQCNWRVAWKSSRMCADERRTLRSNSVTLFSYRTREVPVFVKCDTIFRFIFGNCHNFRLLTFARVWWEVLYECCWKFTWLSSSEKNFENPLRTDKLIAIVYYLFATQCLVTQVTWKYGSHDVTGNGTVR